MILEISVAVIAFFVVVFVIGLLVVLVQIRRTAKEAEKLLDTSRQQIAPLAHDLTIILNDAKKIVQSVQLQMGKIELGVDHLKETAIRISEFEKMVQEKIEQPILEISTLVTAISRALRAFIEIWKK